MKSLKIIGVVVAVLIVLFFVAALFLGPIVKGAVESVGPRVAQVPMELDKARIGLFTGKTELEGLVIGNPEGFRTPQAIKLARFSMDMSVPSILSDRIVIREIVIDGPDITYEMSLSGSNLARIQRNLEGDTGAEAAEKQIAEPSKADGKKVEIESVVIKNGRIRVSSGVMMGKAVTIPLPTIRLEGIGKEKEGATLIEASSRILGAIVGGVVDAVAASGKLIGDGAKAVGSAGVKGAKAGAEAVSDAAGVGKDAVAKGADVATEGVKRVGETVGKGASKLAGGVGRLIGAEKDEEEPEQGGKEPEQDKEQE